MFEIIFAITLSNGQVVREYFGEMHKTEKKCMQEGWGKVSLLYPQIITKNPDMKSFKIECIPQKVWI